VEYDDEKAWEVVRKELVERIDKTREHYR
jgi:hypothetical protein